MGTLLVGAVLAIALCLSWAVSRDSASANSGLACSVKASCGVGEVAVFRMSSTANAHAGTPGGSAYGNVVCCGGIANLGTSCSGVYDTVLTLSAVDNAHVASTGYSTDVCLSVGAVGAVDCTYSDDCGSYACLATISSTGNAHVADCDGSNDYDTKVCCDVDAPLAVGGVAELPAVSDSSGPDLVVLAGAVALALAIFGTGGWYARRWFRTRV